MDIMVLDEKIRFLKEKLNYMIENGCNFDVIYQVSTELDKLIIQYYYDSADIRRAI